MHLCPPYTVPSNYALLITPARRASPHLDRLAPFAGVAAGNQPVDEAGHDARSGHDLDFAAHAVDHGHGIGIEPRYTEIAERAEDGTAGGINQRAADIQRLRDQR